jgi:transposase InsO family protein
VAAVVDLFSRRVVGWSMSAAMTALIGSSEKYQKLCLRGP